MTEKPTEVRILRLKTETDCPICGKRFKNLSAMQLHVNKRCPKGDYSGVKCPRCNRVAFEGGVIPKNEAVRLCLNCCHVTVVEVEDPREVLASAFHDAWSAWASSMLKQEVVSEERAERWRKLIDTPYKDLSDEMKDLDREFADRALRELRAHGALRDRRGQNP